MSEPLPDRNEFIHAAGCSLLPDHKGDCRAADGSWSRGEWQPTPSDRNEPAKARCNLELAEPKDDLQWWLCTACGRYFTEAHPTIVPGICLRDDPLRYVGGVVA